MRVLAAAASLLLCVGAGHGPAWAQAGWYLIPSFTLTEQFDDNIFGTSTDTQSDFISRFSPGLQGGYRSEPFTILLLGEFTAEVFAKNPDLDSATAGKRAGLTLQYLPIRVLTLNFDLSYTETESVTTLAPFLASPGFSSGAGGFTLTPTPTSPTAPTTPTSPTPPPTPGTPPPPAGTSQTATAPSVSTLEFGRQKATILYLSPAVQYLFSPTTSGTAAYSYTRATLQDSPTTITHDISASLNHQFTPLDAGQIRYTFDIFEGTGSDNVTSNALTLGWARQLTPSTSVSLNAGPQFTQGTVTPNVNARLDHRFKIAETLGNAYLSYTHSESLVLGQVGPSTVETYAAGVGFEPIRSLQISVSSAITKLSQTGDTTTTTPNTTTYGVSAGASYQILRWLIARAGYGFSYQEQDAGNIQRNVISVGLEVLYPYRADQ